MNAEIGDWVSATVSGKAYVGFVTEIGMYVTRVCVTHPQEFVGNIVRPTHQNVHRFNPEFIAEEDRSALIDVALDVGDREWFAELCALKAQEATRRDAA